MSTMPDHDDATTSDEEAIFDVKQALVQMVERSRRKVMLDVGMPREVLDKAVLDNTLPWPVRGFIVYHRRNPYERLCLKNSGMEPRPLWATHGGQRVRLMGVKGDSILISVRGDADSKLTEVSLAELQDFGDSRVGEEISTGRTDSSKPSESNKPKTVAAGITEESQ